MTHSRFWLLFSTLLAFTLCAVHHKPKCSRGKFMVGNMTVCHSYLTCLDFVNVRVSKLIGYGAVKWVFLASWNGVFISVSTLKNQLYFHDFHEGLELMKQLSPSQYINQLIGYCEVENIYATEYHQMNNANALKYILENSNRSIFLSRKLCINYVEILKFIHNSPRGIRLNCDSDSIEKIFSQLLVTNRLTLVLSDVDALPELTTNYSITCGRDILQTPVTLSPPELYDVTSKGYALGYTDKSDVWKVPDVCNYLFTLENMLTLRFSSFGINKRCKSQDPASRPTSAELVGLYKHSLMCTNSDMCTPN